MDTLALKLINYITALSKIFFKMAWYTHASGATLADMWDELVSMHVTSKLDCVQKYPPFLFWSSADKSNMEIERYVLVSVVDTLPAWSTSL